VVPEPLLDAIADDDEVCAALESRWGYGSGIYSWFQELSEEEIAEVTGAQGISAPAVERLRELLIDAQPYPSAYIEKTHFEHEALLQAAFAKLGAPDPRKLTKTMIFGQRVGSSDSRLAITSPERSRELRPWLERLNVAEVVRAFDLGPREPADLWREGLEGELQQLVNCHACAAEAGHYVVSTTS
jgi:hypothetical protein